MCKYVKKILVAISSIGFAIFNSVMPSMASDFGKGKTIYSQKDLYKSIKKADYNLTFTNLSKQRVTIKIENKNSNIEKYIISFCRNVNGETKCCDAVKKEIPATGAYISSSTIYSPNEIGAISIDSVYKGRKNWVANGSYYFKLDERSGNYVQSLSTATKVLENAINNHKATATVIMKDSETKKLSFSTIKNDTTDKWNIYNKSNIATFGAVNNYDARAFIDNGNKCRKRYFSMKYRLSKSQDETLRKKYLSISKKAKGSTKSKAKYYVSYLAKNCSYKRTNLPTTYEFLLTKKKGQCYHYADAFAELCNLSGIKCEIVNGKTANGGHSWAIIKIGKKWYWCDPCWADYGNKVGKKWMFKGYDSKDFKKRKLNKEYKTSAWKKAHPLGKSLKY